MVISNVFALWHIVTIAIVFQLPPITDGFEIYLKQSLNLQAQLVQKCCVFDGVDLSDDTDERVIRTTPAAGAAP